MPADRLHLLEPLFESMEDTLIRSCLEGRHGAAYADSPDAPTAARLVVGDFVFFGGDASSAAAPELIADRTIGGCILTPSNTEWAELIRRIYPDAERNIRYAFRKDTRFDSEKLARLAEPPRGFAIRAITADDYPKLLAADWTRDFVSNFSCAAEYEREGLGYLVVTESGEAVAGASSYSRYSGGIEIQVETREDYRRRGLATVCSARLMLGCLERGLCPSWDAANPTSAKLAVKLGFEPKGEYEVFEI